MVFALGITDIDLTLREDKHDDLNDQSTLEQKDYFIKWKKSNRRSLIAIKRSVSEYLLSGLLEINNAKKLFDAIGQRYLVSENAKSKCLMRELVIMHELW